MNEVRHTREFLIKFLEFIRDEENLEDLNQEAYMYYYFNNEKVDAPGLFIKKYLWKEYEELHLANGESPGTAHFTYMKTIFPNNTRGVRTYPDDERYKKETDDIFLLQNKIIAEITKCLPMECIAEAVLKYLKKIDRMILFEVDTIVTG